MPITFAAVVLLGMAMPSTDVLPQFSVRIQPAARAVPVQHRTAWARRFRSELDLQGQQPVNFAGHYVLATIGCGASCIMLSAIDKRDGAVVALPQTVCCWPDAVMEPLKYRADSRLLIAQGQLNEKGTLGRHRFVLSSGHFRELPEHRTANKKRL